MDTVKSKGMRVANNNFDKLQAGNGLTAKGQTQMDRIVASLQLSGKPEADEATAKTKLTTRAAKLKDLHASLSKMHVRLAELSLLDQPRQVKRLTASMKAVEAMLSSKPPIGISKHLRICMNELTSLREGVWIGAATKKRSLTVKSVNATVDVIKDLQTKTQEKIELLDTEASDGLFTNDAQKVVDDSASESNKLQSIHKREYVIARVPLVPVAKGFLSIDSLRSSGFKVESLGGYPVIRNQLVIGINPSMLDEKQRAKTKPEDWLKAAEIIRRMVQKQQGTRLSFVSEKPYGAVGGAWFWLMTDRDMSLFTSAFSGKRIQLSSWGLAF